MSNQTKDAARERAKLKYFGTMPPTYAESDAFRAGYAAALARTCKWTWEEDENVPQASGYKVGCSERMLEDEIIGQHCPYCGGRVVQEEQPNEA